MLSKEDAANLKPLYTSTQWQGLKEFLEGRREWYVKRLLSDIDHSTSMELRGRIREIDTLLNAPAELQRR